MSGGHLDIGSNEGEALSAHLSLGAIWKVQGLDQTATDLFQF